MTADSQHQKPIRLLSCAITISFMSFAQAEPVKVSADFSRGANYPLSKEKFAVFNSGFITLDQYKRDMHLYEEVKPSSLRVDLWWGGNRWKPAVISGTSESLAYNFEEMDAIATLLHQRNVMPYWAYCYIPKPLQSLPGDHRSTPTSYHAWGQILKKYARHASRSPEYKVGFHEIYNEPDNKDFFIGGLKSYLEMYKHGVQGIRAGDHDAVVGGPAIAFTDSWIGEFLDYVSSNSLPLDFFSFHYYPTVPYESDNIADVIQDMRTKLAAHPELATTEMHLNEYNSYKIDYPEGGRQDKFAIASAMLKDFHYFLTQPDLTLVHWAQFQDTGGGNWSGMISHAGYRKALFNAYKIYQNMPVDRNQLEFNNSDAVGGFASSNSTTADVLLWNQSEETKSIDLRMENLPFSAGHTSVSRIDENNSSWGDNPANENLTALEQHEFTTTRNFQWGGALAPGAIVYLRSVSTNAAAADPPVPDATIIRMLRHFPDRCTSSYADFDQGTWTFRLGMADEKIAVQQIGVIAELPPTELKVSADTEGEFNTSGVLALRLDFHVTGTISKSIVAMLRNDSSKPCFQSLAEEVQLPWASTKPVFLEVEHGDDSFKICLMEHAPDGWNGRVSISAIMKNTGSGTRARVQLSPKNSLR